MQSESEPELSVAWALPVSARDRHQVRHFVGVHWEATQAVLQAALVRVWGSGFSVLPEVVAQSRLQDPRLSPWPIGSDTRQGGPSPDVAWGPTQLSEAELAELVSDVVAPLSARMGVDQASLRAIGLHNVGVWLEHGARDREYVARCDTALLAKSSGLTVVDHFPARDLAHRGAGGPLEAAGLWTFLADRSLLPGRRIRAFLEVDQAARLFLLPPRQLTQLPTQLMSLDIGPAYSWMDGVLAELGLSKSVCSDERGVIAVQGRLVPELAELWREFLRQPAQPWTPRGPSSEEWLEIFRTWSHGRSLRIDDLLCTMVQKLAERIVSALKNQLPRSQPVGQLILGGRGQRNSLLIHQIQQQLPELEILALDDFSIPAESWRAACAAILAQFHVDQIPATTPSLTGADSPRILGRITPGTPSNWHRVLADMALTLPDKVTLRSAV